MKAVLGLPQAIVATDKPHGDTVTQELAINQTKDAADPVNKGNFGTGLISFCETGDGRESKLLLTSGVFFNREAINATNLLGQLKPDRRQRVQSHVEPKADSVESGDNQQNWGDEEPERSEEDGDLCCCEPMASGTERLRVNLQSHPMSHVARPCFQGRRSQCGP